MARPRAIQGPQPWVVTGNARDERSYPRYYPPAHLQRTLAGLHRFEPVLL